MNVANLGPKARLDKGVCLTLAINIRHTLSDNSKQFTDYIRYYDSIEKQLQAINDYANQCYREIQFSIFNNAGQNYFSLLKQLHSLPDNGIFFVDYLKIFTHVPQVACHKCLELQS